MKFAEATAVEKVGDGSYAGEVHPNWDIAGITNGGYLIAILARAMGEEAPGRELKSVSARFLNPGFPGPVTMEVETLKEGKGTTTLQGQLFQGGKTLFTAHATYSVPGMGSEIDASFRPAPEVRPPEECPRLVPALDGSMLPPPFTANVDLMMEPESLVMGPAAQGRAPDIKGWFRLLDGELLDPYGLVLAADAFPPAVFTAGFPLGWTPTVDISIYIRDPGPHEIVKAHVHTRHVTNGWLEEDVELWDTAGRLVAQSRQLALLAKG